MIKNLHRISFLLGIFSLLISSLSVVTGHAGLALRIIQYAFGLFTLAVCFYILEAVKK